MISNTFQSELADKTWFLDLLKSVENTYKDKPHFLGMTNKGGWRMGKWYPHPSHEGGNDTIAYGAKLYNDSNGNPVYIMDIDGEKVDVRLGITEEQAEKLLVKRVMAAEHKAMTEYNKFRPNGDKVWAELNETQKAAFTEIAFNIGTLQGKSGKYKGKWGWPNLAKLLDGDQSGINKKNLYDELLRKDGTDSGKFLITRTKALTEAFLGRMGKNDLYKDAIQGYQKLEKMKGLVEQLPKEVQGEAMQKIDTLINLARQQESAPISPSLLVEASNEISASLEEQTRIETEERLKAEEALIAEAEQEQRSLEQDMMREEDTPLDLPPIPEAQVNAKPIVRPNIQYFQREDGKVVGMDEAGNVEELF